MEYSKNGYCQESSPRIPAAAGPRMLTIPFADSRSPWAVVPRAPLKKSPINATERGVKPAKNTPCNHPKVEQDPEFLCKHRPDTGQSKA